MTDELITELAHIPTLRVVSRTSVMQDKNTKKSLQQIARELNVDAIVEGSVVRSGDEVRITAQLIDARTDKHLWAQSFEGQTGDILALQDSVARNIASNARLALAPAASIERSTADQPSPAAHDAYLRGLYFQQKREPGKGAEYFQQAIQLDPNYAKAYTGLANSFHAEIPLGISPPDVAAAKGVAAAKRAIELDPSDGTSYIALGGIQTMSLWDFAAAEQNLTHGLALNPNDSFAENLYTGYLDAVNRPEEAVVHMRRALELDPFSFFMNRNLGSALYFARHYDEALDYLQRAREMEPAKPGFYDNWASWIYDKKGMRDEAIKADLSSDHYVWPKLDVEALRSVYQKNGWKAFWEARIQALQPYKNGYCAAYHIGVSYIETGNRDLAFSELNRAVDQRCFWMVWIKVDPLMDDIHTDPRYKDLLHRINLPE